MFVLVFLLLFFVNSSFVVVLFFLKVKISCLKFEEGPARPTKCKIISVSTFVNFLDK